MVGHPLLWMGMLIRTGMMDTVARQKTKITHGSLWTWARDMQSRVSPSLTDANTASLINQSQKTNLYKHSISAKFYSHLNGYFGNIICFLMLVPFPKGSNGPYLLPTCWDILRYFVDYFSNFSWQAVGQIINEQAKCDRTLRTCPHVSQCLHGSSDHKHVYGQCGLVNWQSREVSKTSMSS